MLDFAHSYLTFRIDLEKKPPQTASHRPPYSLNNARIQIECRCRITQRDSGDVRTFVLGASCKTERVGVERDIWTEPNADFAPILSHDEYLNIKTYARAGVQVELYPPGSGFQSDRQAGRTAEAFDSLKIDLLECPSRQLATAEEIVEATLANKPLVARTQIESERYVAELDYPVKTINANERDTIYQTDTGPVLMPDLACDPADLATRFELAYSAFNCPAWTEFLIREPTTIADGVQVFHFVRPLRLDARNEIHCGA